MAKANHFRVLAAALAAGPLVGMMKLARAAFLGQNGKIAFTSTRDGTLCGLPVAHAEGRLGVPEIRSGSDGRGSWVEEGSSKDE